MTKSKKFWAASAFVSLAVMVFAGYSIYGRMTLHFSGDTIEVRPVPVPVPQEEEEDTAAKEAAAAKEEKKDREEEAKAGKAAAAPAKAVRQNSVRPPEPAAAETGKTRAVKTTFEYKDAAARSVLIAGSFTSWKDKKMTKKDGVWKTDVYILPGTYPYHFTVDGKKKLDPGKPKAPTGDSLVQVN
ncbi:MAG: glycogen-binding domain-containing protein [Elusimicrobiota bacterium]|nr:glycogen-binding domain-containing protein [Elusimicrobiota bacterium]